MRPTFKATALAAALRLRPAGGVTAGPALNLDVEIIESTRPYVFVALRAGETVVFTLDLSKAVLFDAETGATLKHSKDFSDASKTGTTSSRGSARRRPNCPGRPFRKLH